MMPCPICDEKPINCQCTQAELRMHYEIEELEEKVPRWIPVSERLPEDGQAVIVFWSKYKQVGEAVFGKEEGFFSTDRGGCYDISHWMPLPEPPEVG